MNSDPKVNKLRRSKRRARKIENVFRFIDDLTTLNDGGEFELSFKEVYPLELVLEKGECRS